VTGQDQPDSNELPSGLERQLRDSSEVLALDLEAKLNVEAGLAAIIGGGNAASPGSPHPPKPGLSGNRGGSVPPAGLEANSTAGRARRRPRRGEDADSSGTGRARPGLDDRFGTRIAGYEPLLSPAALLDELPLGDEEREIVEEGRTEVIEVLEGTDDRLLVVVGPCTIHDPRGALDYAARIALLRERFADDLLIVMRAYFEKQRTVYGWRGLINDPDMDDSCDTNRGFRIARRLLLDILALGVPVGCEWLDPVTPQYIADTVTWCAIGARTVESQLHRQLASGLYMPVGFKNSTDGDVQNAVDALRASARSHTFVAVTHAGANAVVTTTGNPDTHVILRGGRSGPNYHSSQVAKALDMISAAGQPRRIMVDASHGNSGKDHTRQPGVAASLAEQLASGEQGIVGVMLLSFLVAGRQNPGNQGYLTYGQSVTDACMDIEMTASVLETLATAARQRRAKLNSLTRQ
jgi:3-deoxy-7-phosphoheptulonate synthase